MVNMDLEKILLFSDLVLLKCRPRLKQLSWRCRMMAWTRSEMQSRGRRGGRATLISRASVLERGKGWRKWPWWDIRETDKGGKCYQVHAILYGVHKSVWKCYDWMRCVLYRDLRSLPFDIWVQIDQHRYERHGFHGYSIVSRTFPVPVGKCEVCSYHNIDHILYPILLHGIWDIC